MDKQEFIAEVAAAALVELDKMEKRRVQVSSPREMLKELFKGVIDPKPAEDNSTPFQAPPEIPPEFPRLLASYGQKTLEYIVVNNSAEWAPYHDWYTVFPPQQPASRPIATTLEAEVEKLKADGVPERPKEDWQRRKEAASKK
jgi:hypothetical protein